MLDTLIKLGQQLSDGRGEWDDIIDFPNITKEREKNIKCFIAELVFDLDAHTIYVSPELREYDEQDCFKYKNIKIQTGNNKAVYCCVESGKVEQIRKTFFGTIDSKGKVAPNGHLKELIGKEYPQFKDKVLDIVLSQIFTLKSIFEEKFTILNPKESSELIIDEKLILGSQKSDPSNKIVIIFTSVICSSLGINKVTPISDIVGYEEIIKLKFFNKKSFKKSGHNKLCYATGKVLENVSEVQFDDRDILTKMFVKKTRNYASEFDKNKFRINYQVNDVNQLYLIRASKYLNGNNRKLQIAGINHCIIPQFLHHNDIDLKYLLSGIRYKSELLFHTKELEEVITSIEYQIDEPYWITYLAYQTDGTFFKTINEIKDVSKTHFYKLLDHIDKVDKYFRKDLRFAVDWEAVMKNYGKNLTFNLGSIYSIIPIRKDEKKNNVLALFKMIFENRKITCNKIYRHFCNLILCFRYGRYDGYVNIKENLNLDFAIRDSVFKYFALITFLKQLNLLSDMEQNEITLAVTEEIPNEYEKRIELFFKQMNYNSDQKAMFFLGRMLSAVAYLQKDKNKTVIGKVNFSGMDKEDIRRLHNSLMEKAQQYNKIEKVVFSDGDFVTYFNYNSWLMNREEAVFFLLSGYSFGTI